MSGKICFCGNLGKKSFTVNGQTIKTDNVLKVLIDKFGKDEICIVDSSGNLFDVLLSVFKLVFALKDCTSYIMMPGRRGIFIYSFILALFNVLFKKRIYYIVVGGWLDEYCVRYRFLCKVLKYFDKIYAETNYLKVILGQKARLNNIDVIPNFKDYAPLKELSKFSPYSLCTFSRVTEDKGISIACRAVIEANKILQENKYLLTVYGPVSADYKEEFQRWCNDYEFIRYGGILEGDMIKNTLSEYAFLLFPTYYDGECFAGSVVDAYFAGLPVIASDFKSNSEVVIDNYTGYIVPVKDFSKIKDILIEIAENSYPYELRKNCLKESSKYSPETALKILYDKLKEDTIVPK